MKCPLTAGWRHVTSRPCPPLAKLLSWCKLCTELRDLPPRPDLTMRLPSLPVNAQAAVAAALMCCSLTLAPPAFGADSVDNIYGTAGEFTKATTLDGGYRGSVPGQDKQIAAGKGAGAEKMENSKIQGGGASTLQGGRRIVITRGVNLDSEP